MTWKDKFPKDNIYYETDNGVLYNGDALEILNKFTKDSIDTTITDLPYNLTACKWDNLIPFDKMWDRLNNVVQQQGAFILFGNEPFSSALRMSNIKNYKYDWKWDKVRGSNFATVKIRPFNSFEDIMIFYRKQPTYNPQMWQSTPYKCKQGYVGESKQTGLNRKEVITESKGERYPLSIIKFSKDKGLHPTQKPLLLMEYLIKTYSNEGDIILDFTSGSGTTLLACQNLNREFIGIEKDIKYCEITKKRLKEANESS